MLKSFKDRVKEKKSRSGPETLQTEARADDSLSRLEHEPSNTRPR